MTLDPAAQITRLLDIMAALRDPRTGCPWDIEQDFASIAPYTIEEAHEVEDAIQRQAWDELPGELGDMGLRLQSAQRSADWVSSSSCSPMIVVASSGFWLMKLVDCT